MHNELCNFHSFLHTTDTSALHSSKWKGQDYYCWCVAQWATPNMLENKPVEKDHTRLHHEILYTSAYTQARQAPKYN